MSLNNMRDMCFMQESKNVYDKFQIHVDAGTRLNQVGACPSPTILINFKISQQKTR